MDIGTIIASGLAGSGHEVKQYFIEFFFGTFFPAFILAAGIKSFIRERSITRWLGPKVKPLISYSFAMGAGMLFSVCACGVLPLFASIYRHGAGVGPAVTFLVAGPAINITAVILTTLFFGWGMTIARTIGALGMAVIIGLAFAAIFKQPDDEEESIPVPACDCREEPAPDTVTDDDDLLDPAYNYLADEELDEAYIPLARRHLVTLFIITFGYMLTGPVDFTPWLGPLKSANLKLSLLVGYIVYLAFFLFRVLSSEERRDWLNVVGHFIWKISWPLVTGLALLGFVKGNLSDGLMFDLVTRYLGDNGITSLAMASLFAVPTYFGTCISVMYVKFFVDFGMASGPGLAMFLAGPTISIPSFLPMVQIMGWKRASFVTGTIFILAIVLPLLLAPLYM